MEVRVKDVMRRNFRFLIRDEFRHDLFNRAIEKEGMIKNLAEKLGCKPDTIRKMKIGQTKFIKWQIVKKLIEIVGITEEELEPHVLAVKAGTSGRINEVKFPINESPELALLVAKGLGDGSIEKNFRFSFWNKERALIDEFSETVIKVTGKTKVTINELKDGRIHAKCNPFVGLVAHLNGVPIGDKTLQEFDVPEWIKSGPKEIRVSFIRGLFDDEACIRMKSEKNRSRSIIIAQGKLVELRSSLENFFSSIKKMLLEFGIKSSKVTKQGTFIDEKGREKIVLRFSISGKDNLEKFLNEIGFAHPEKRLKLKKAIESFVDIHKTKKIVLETVLKSSRPLSTSEISKLVGINVDLASFHLNELAKSGKIFKNNSTNPNFWFKKDLSSFNFKEKENTSSNKKFCSSDCKRNIQMTGINEKRVFDYGRILKRKYK